MKERPILFSGPMVRAILSGKKTQTRRVFKGNGGTGWQMGGCYGFSSKGYAGPLTQEYLWGAVSHPTLPPCTYGGVGDHLWVRETWNDSPGSVLYRADGESLPCGSETCRWRPSIFMPRWASRITLKITGVRVERVQDISEADAMAEGVGMSLRARLAGVPDDETVPLNGKLEPSYRNTYAGLWDTLNAKRGYGWATNPWVFAITFRVLTPTPGATQ